MTAASPWTPEPGTPAAVLHAAEPAYKAMMLALCLARAPTRAYLPCPSQWRLWI
jgi:hypothetical protein